MTNRAGPHVRLAQADDVAFLGAMLAEAADWRPGSPVRPVTEVLGDPALARYVEGWPRAGDLGVVAVAGDQPLGAAWYRHFDGNHAGYGYVAPDVPELAIGVRPEHRGRGIGRRLLDALVAEASARGVGRISLSVELDNPSKHLYDRVGFVAVGTNRGSVTMVLDCARARRATSSDVTASSEATVQVSPLEPGDGDVAVRVLTEAFWAYPETLHLLPDAVARRRVLPRYLASDHPTTGSERSGSSRLTKAVVRGRHSSVPGSNGPTTTAPGRSSSPPPRPTPPGTPRSASTWPPSTSPRRPGRPPGRCGGRRAAPQPEAYVASMIPTRPFGSTGHDSTRVIFGAAALGAMSQARADATLQLVGDAGVNHIDTAASYGESELRLAPWLEDHRADVFLATKTGERRGADARAELERSLVRLGVDHVDLIQLHNLVEDDEWRTALAPGGAVEAMVQARDEGLVRFIGVTGHGLRIAGMHSRSLAAFPFDSVLLPYSPILLRHAGYRDDVDELRTICRKRGVAVQTIKAIARRRWRDDDDARKFSWYEPLRDPAAIERAMRFVLAKEDLFLNTSSDATLLPTVLEVAGRLGQQIPAPDAAELDADIDAHDVQPLFDGGALERI